MKLVRKFFCLACVALTALLAACSSEADKLQVNDITGYWQLQSWSVDSAFKGNVYLDLRPDMSFVLYQDITSHGFKSYTGTFLLDTKHAVVSGTYSDGTLWANQYLIEFTDSKHMTWKVAETDEASVYVRVNDLPATVAPVQRGEVEQRWL